MTSAFCWHPQLVGDAFFSNMPDFDNLNHLFESFNASTEFNGTDEELKRFADHLLHAGFVDYDFGFLEENITIAPILPVHDFPADYRITATFIHALIFVVGAFGNLVVIAASRKSRSLKTPTYTYLVRLEKHCRWYISVLATILDIRYAYSGITKDI